VAEWYEPLPVTKPGEAESEPAESSGPAPAYQAQPTGPAMASPPAYQAPPTTSQGSPSGLAASYQAPPNPAWAPHSFAPAYQARPGFSRPPAFAPPAGPGYDGALGFGGTSGEPGQTQMRPPSGLFPGLPPRPVYREPHPVRSGPVFAGLGSAILWFVLFGTLGRDLASYAWWTIVAGVTAWAVALVLSIFGNRGVAVGIALASGFGLSIAMGLVAERWITTENWPLW
jgi:hypothetical protein